MIPSDLSPDAALRLLRDAEPVVLFDLSGVCRYANEAARAFLGLPADATDEQLAATITPAVFGSFQPAEPGDPDAARDERLRRTLEGIDAIVCYQERAGAPVIASPAVERILGHPPEALRSITAWDALIHPDDMPHCREAWTSDAPGWVLRYRMRHADGRWIWLADRGRWIDNGRGRPRGIVSVAVDATEMMERAAELRASEARYRTLTDTAPDAILTLDAQGTVVAANPAVEAVFGWPRHELEGRSIRELAPPEMLAFHGARLSASLAGAARPVGSPVTFEAVRRDGSIAIVEVATSAWGEGDRRFLTAICRDVTTLQAERADLLRLATAMQLMTESVMVADGSGALTYVNPAFERITGYTRDEVIGRNARLLRSGEHAPAYYQAMWAELSAGRRWTGELVNLRKDGTRFVEEASITPVRDEAGTINGYVAVKRDVTVERAALEALRASEHRLRATFEGLNGLVIYQDAPHLPMMLSAECERVLGYPPGEIASYATYDQHVHPDDVAACLEAWQHPSGAWDIEYRFQHADGHWLWLNDRGHREWTPEGTTHSFVSVIVDVTARHNLEAQLRQAQRLEAVGQLAGGVAHDMNNILAAISGYSRFVEQDLPPDSPAADDIHQVLVAADRASQLTRQLLAFSRRQPLAPRLLQVSDVIDDLVPMLGRLLGTHVAMEVVHEPDAPSAMADAGQLEQVVVNLAVNARDAMPDGGRLVIRTGPAPVPPEMAVTGARACVRIEVEDTGTGMDEATLGQIFTPFFTTKGPGKGTGLGLATVYGIVTGSNGKVSVRSTPGQGSTFVVELPGTPAPAAAPVAPTPIPRPAPAAKGERILLVEDEAAVRTVTARLLRGMGYEVLAAASGDEALALAVQPGFSVDIVVSDVRMPGLQGPEMLARIRRQFPRLPAIFLSGYAPELEGTDVELGARLIQKPCSSEVLGAAVRAALDDRP